jgi:hypothetical protein
MLDHDPNPLEDLAVCVCVWLGCVGVLWLGLIIMQRFGAP